MMQNKDSHVFHRSSVADYPVAVAGDGCYLVDSDGKRYLDGCCGAAVSCLGHSNQEVRDAIKQQVDQLAFAHTGFFSNEPMEKLADWLIAHAPEGMDRVYFCSGGSEAMEAALKMTRQYYLERGEPERKHVIARRQSYHGNTIGALSAGGNQWRRQQFEPMLVQMHHISPCYAYRYQEEGETEEAYGQRIAQELEDKILELGPETVLAFAAEPVVGATMGAVPAVTGYMKRVREICTKYDIVLLLDEVMCGAGRTGTYFACEQDEVAPDIVLMAKGLGAGYQPIGAALVSKKIHDTIRDGSGFFQHGHTYIGHALACAASLKVCEIIERDGLLARVTTQGEALHKALQERFNDHPYVGDIRGRGMFLGLELVADRATKAPPEPDLRWPAKIKQAAMQDGLMCYPMAGTIDGKLGAHILLAPPFILEDAQIDELVSKLAGAIGKIGKSLACSG